MPIIDGVKYPDTFLDVTKDKDLRPLLLRVIKQAGDEGYIEMIKENPHVPPKELYAKFFNKGAQFELSSLNTLCKAARLLAANNRWSDTGAWQRIHKEARRLAFLNLDQVSVREVYQSRTFTRIHVANVKSCVKLTPAMLKTLGIADTKALTDLIAALRMGEMPAAEKTAAKIIKEEKLNQRPKELVAAVKKLVR